MTRHRCRTSPSPAAARLAGEYLGRLETPSLRRVLNLTGTVLHTNLGRAPLAEAALQAVTDVARGYSTLEYDLAAGKRGERHVHVEELLCRLTGGAGRHGGEQQRRGGAVGPGRPGRRQERPGFARRADRDRRLVPHPRDHGRRRGQTGRGRHHQQDPPRRLPQGHRRRHRPDPQGPHQQLPDSRLHRRGARRGAGGARQGARHPGAGRPRQRPAHGPDRPGAAARADRA